ncbi:MAG: acyl-CoA dehydrogenase family protein, partial [Proteobacteria bacterium]|nr:acyl-CoA dehydrogenase family protein [Pseudomonadota bacterium]
MTAPYLTEERLMIQDVARTFTLKEVLPVANALDPVQGQIPMDLRKKMGEMGYFGIQMSEEHGGMGLGVFEYCLIAEELARGWMSVASIIARANSMMNVGGWTEAKRRELTARAAQGDYLAAVSLS